MTKHLMLGVAAGAAFALAMGTARMPTQDFPFPTSKCSAEAVTFNDIRVPQPVLANGETLAAGVYQVRITAERPMPARGQSAAGECWVEFLAGGAVAGRDLASVVSAEDIASVAKGQPPKPNQARVDVLKDGDYVRVWMNDAGTHYIVNLPAVR